jgi:hypothetical protein
MIESLTYIVYMFIDSLNAVLKSVLNWSIICIQAIASFIYFLYTAIIQSAIAAYYLLIASSRWLFSFIAAFFHWLSKSLGIAENGILYIFALVIVAMIFMLSKLVGQAAYLRTENEQIKRQEQERKEQENRKAIIDTVIKVVHWFTQQ